MRRYIQFLTGLALLASLPACGSGNDTADLNITGVDYAGNGIGGFYVVDPDNEKNRGDGESLTPYSAGGTRCCYQMPKEWHEGLKIDVVVRYPLEGETGDEISASLAKRKAEGKLTETIHVDVPKYETPAKGTLWVQFLSDKKANVVVSDLSPPHKDFPGEVKGWPAPSDEYKNKIIDRDLEDVSSRLERTQDSLKKIRVGDGATLKKYWDIMKDVFPKDIADFDGWKDPEFKIYMGKSLESDVERDKKLIARLERLRP